MVTVRKSKLLLTSSTIQPNTYYYEFDVDTISELPDPYYNGTIVAHGSKATIINSGEIYRINGDGEWKAQSTSGGAGLPEVTSEDNGDVLTVVGGAWDKAEPAKELPTVTSADNGDVLTVVEGAWAKGALPIPESPVIYLTTDEFGKLPNGMTRGDVYNLLETGKYVVIKWRDMIVLTPAGKYGHKYTMTAVSLQSSSTGSKPVFSIQWIEPNSTDEYIAPTASTLATV